MNIQECIKFANDNPTCSFATIDDQQPRVRMMGLWYADSSGFYFQTDTSGKIYNQLKSNQKVEICFFKRDNVMGTMLRISGKVEFLSDKNLKNKVLKDRPFLMNLGMTEESPDLIILRINHSESQFWSINRKRQTKKG